MKHPDILFGRLGNRLFQMAYILAQASEGNVPDIYIQDPKYFDKYEKEIKNFLKDSIILNPFVSIHVRRGDYVNNPFYVDLTKTDYYDRAIEMFPNERFMVFSDDTEFCKNFFHKNRKDPERFIIATKGTELEDFNLAAGCRHHIIANSSFSWWYSWICPQVDKKVVAPSIKNWYSDGIERTKCPSSWIRI